MAQCCRLRRLLGPSQASTSRCFSDSSGGRGKNVGSGKVSVVDSGRNAVKVGSWESLIALIGDEGAQGGKGSAQQTKRKFSGRAAAEDLPENAWARLLAQVFGGASEKQDHLRGAKVTKKKLIQVVRREKKNVGSKVSAVDPADTTSLVVVKKVIPIPSETVQKSDRLPKKLSRDRQKTSDRGEVRNAREKLSSGLKLREIDVPKDVEAVKSVWNRLLACFAQGPAKDDQVKAAPKAVKTAKAVTVARTKMQESFVDSKDTPAVTLRTTTRKQATKKKKKKKKKKVAQVVKEVRMPGQGKEASSKVEDRRKAMEVEKPRTRTKSEGLVLLPVGKEAFHDAKVDKVADDEGKKRKKKVANEAAIPIQGTKAVKLSEEERTKSTKKKKKRKRKKKEEVAKEAMVPVQDMKILAVSKEASKEEKASTAVQRPWTFKVYKEQVEKVREILRVVEESAGSLEVMMSWFADAIDKEVGMGVLRGIQDVDQAVAFFNWMELQRGIMHDSLYSCVLERLVKAGRLDAGDAFLRELLQLGVQPDFLPLKLLIEGWCKLGKILQAMEVYHLMQERYMPDQFVYNVLIEGLCNVQDFGGALQLIRFMLEEGRATPNDFSFNIVIGGLCKAAQMDEAMEAYRHMRNSSYQVDVVTYNNLIEGLCAQEKVDEAYQLFKLMPEEGCIPNNINYNTMISGLCKAGRINEAFYLMTSMSQKGYSPDAYTYNTIISGLGKAGQMLEAMQVYEDMTRSSFCSPDVVTFNSLMDGFCSAGKVDEAYVILKVMLEKGCLPNEASYNTVLDGLCKTARVEEAKQLFDCMEHLGCIPNARGYNILIRGLCQQSDVENACLIFEEMVKKSVSPDHWSYNILIDGLVSVGKLEEAHKLFQEALQSDITPTVVTYNSILHGLCSCPSLEEAQRVFQDMSTRGCAPNERTFNIMIDAFCKKGNLLEACKLLNKMQEDGYVPNVVTYNTLIHGLCGVNRVDEAHQLLKDMTERDCKPTVITQNTLIHGLCKAGRIAEARQVLDGMLAYGLSPDVVSFNTLVHGLCKTGNTDDAVKLLSDMVGKGYTPDVVTYTALILGLCKARRLKDACSIFKVMKDCGCAPNLFTYTPLIQSFCVAGRLDDALGLFGEMISLGVLPDNVVYGTLAAELWRQGRTEKAHEILREARVQLRGDEIYSRTVGRLLHTGKAQEALVLMRDMVKQGLVPPPEGCATAIVTLSNSGHVGEAQVLLQDIVTLAYGEASARGKAALFLKEMMDKGYQINNAAYETLLAGLS